MSHHWQEILAIDRYVVSSNGLLYDYDRKILSLLYQPLIGSLTFSLFMTLWSELEENRLWGESSSHHRLMCLMDINLRDIYHARLKLEGIGLLKTYVKTDENERSFIYELQTPLSPEQFFQDGMLNVFLYRKIGKNHYLRLKQFFSDRNARSISEYKDVTKSFENVYASISPESFNQFKHEDELETDQILIGRQISKELSVSQNSFNFDLLLSGLKDSLVSKSAFNAKVREAISNLAFLYEIDAIQMQKIVLDSITPDDEISIDELRKHAREFYKIEHYNEPPVLVDRIQPEIYHSGIEAPKTKEEIQAHYYETVSPRQFLEDISGGAQASSADLKIIEEVMLEQRLLPGVVNVLIHFIMLRSNMKLTKSYVKKIASQWARLEIKTVKDAMELARSEHKEEKKSNRRSQAKPIRTEKLPEWFEKNKEQKQSEKSNDNELNFDFEAEKRKLEEELKKYKK